MRILALDLGTHTGWCHFDGIKHSLGTWTLATPAEVKMWGKNRMTRRDDPRVARLFARVQPFMTFVDAVIFEDVEFQTYTQQCQLWSSLRAAVWLAFADRGVPNAVNYCRIIECVPVATLKKFATGHGGATKQMMTAAAIRHQSSTIQIGTQGYFRLV